MVRREQQAILYVIGWDSNSRPALHRFGERGPVAKYLVKRALEYLSRQVLVNSPIARPCFIEIKELGDVTKLTKQKQKWFRKHLGVYWWFTSRGGRY